MTRANDLIPNRRQPSTGVVLRGRTAVGPEVGIAIAGPARAGLLLMGIFVFGFGAWAGLVPLAGGAVAPGVISPDGSRRVVQHLEGGIVRRLHVIDGDVVTAGQPLVSLEPVQAKATFDSIQSEHRTATVTRLRLEAEEAGHASFEVPANFVVGDRQLGDIIAGQKMLIKTRAGAHEAQLRVLNQRIRQFGEQIIGYTAQVDSATRQLELIADELVGKRALYNKGLVTKPVLRALERAEADLSGRRGEYRASIARTRQQIGETELQIQQLVAERDKEIATELNKMRLSLATLDERMKSSSDILERTVVTAPVGGRVVNLRYKTIGGVVQAGSPIVEIVPSDEPLVIDARVSPLDVDIVHAGLKAEVQLTAFSGNTTPRVQARLKSVSADRLIDEATRQPYFLARVEVDRDALNRLGSSIQLMAGMPADVLIVTGERTLTSYLLRPFLDAIWRTFREA